MRAIEKVRQVISDSNLQAAVLTTRPNYAWLTGGGYSAVADWTSTGVASLVVTADSVFLVADNIETSRLLAEEAGDLDPLPKCFDWWTGNADSLAEELTAGLRVGSDTPRANSVDLSASLAHARSVLSSAELDRYRQFAPAASSAVERVLQRIEPGWTERRISGNVMRAALEEGLRPAVVLVGVDDRLYKYRHPVVTDAKLERYAMVVLCAERHGLIANTTRFVHFGAMPSQLVEKHQACAEVLSSTVLRTVPGATYQDLWQHIVSEYARVGFAEEWKLHHQGGPTGFAAREWLITPETDGEVQENMAFAWNPSVAGAKAEDTILVTSSGSENITLTDGWPRVAITTAAGTLERASVLER